MGVWLGNEDGSCEVEAEPTGVDVESKLQDVKIEVGGLG